MPEYLAPGVFVEETSFRAKSIEGVSTSTTGFVGPTRRGPLARPNGDQPATVELLTSYFDFRRLYGGFENLQYDGEAVSINYLAHAVQAYFDNGGSRLYVARVYSGNGGRAASQALVAGSPAAFIARFPGHAGNGLMRISVRGEPVNRQGLERATVPVGSVARTRANTAAATGAVMRGMPRPEAVEVPQDSRLMLTVNGGPVDVTPFHGEPVELIGGNGVLANPVNLGANNVLTVVIEGRTTVITLPGGATQPADLIAAINRELRGGYARAEGQNVAIGSDVFGRAARVQVMSSSAGAALGFGGDPVRAGDDVAANTVADIRAGVTAADLQGIFTRGGWPITATRADGRFVISTVGTGGGVDVAIRVPNPVPAGVQLAHGLFGFTDTDSSTGEPGGAAPTYYVRGADRVWRDAGNTALDPADGNFELVTVTVEAVEALGPGEADTDGERPGKLYEAMGFDPSHPRYIGAVMATEPTRRSDRAEQMFAYAVDPTGGNAAPPSAIALAQALVGRAPERLTGGDDGPRPVGADYEAALTALAAIEDISIVAAPGSSAPVPGGAPDPSAAAVRNALINHAEQRRAYRIAVLDTRQASSIGEARDDRAPLDSTRAALYTPFVVVPNPLYRTGNESQPREIAVPPSGAVCGVYARNDITRGVFKAPANEVVRGALRHDLDINFAQQETLNPIGINCLRFFPNRGNRVWGARTLSSDPEWKYVNIRRYFNYLERSIDVGTQWAVFEPNGERLWANIRETIASFLVNEWRSGALLGTSIKEAFFVRCDRSTMDQNDLDNGRLVCLIGVAVVKPAEFVIFRIGQKTVDSRS